MSRKEDVYKPALKGRAIPILTLDHRWHQLFAQAQPSARLDELEQQLNALLRRQGKLSTDLKRIEKLREKLRNDVMETVDMLNGEEPDSLISKRLDDNEKLLKECNEKLSEYRLELGGLPARIDEVNEKLMLETMEICYRSMKDNAAEIESLDKWIRETRLALKKNVVRREEKEKLSQGMYTYMHTIFGPRVIELFEMKYIPGDKKLPHILPEETDDGDGGNGR